MAFRNGKANRPLSSFLYRFAIIIISTSFFLAACADSNDPILLYTDSFEAVGSWELEFDSGRGLDQARAIIAEGTLMLEAQQEFGCPSARASIGGIEVENSGVENFQTTVSFSRFFFSGMGGGVINLTFPGQQIRLFLRGLHFETNQLIIKLEKDRFEIFSNGVLVSEDISEIQESTDTEISIQISVIACGIDAFASSIVHIDDLEIIGF